MGDTPRTDELYGGIRWIHSDLRKIQEMTDFARTLERELARATRERDEAENALKAIGYEKHGFGWGITLAEDSKPLAK